MKKLLFALVFIATSFAATAQDTPTKPNLKDYIGEYKTDNENIGKVIVKIEKDKLSAIISSGEDFVLEHVKGDEFIISGESISVLFTRDKEKQVVGFISTLADGSETKGTRIKEESDLNEYSGEYWAEDKDTPLTIKIENGKMLASTGGEQWFELKRIKGDDFEVDGISAGVTFTRDKDKKVDGVKVVDPGGNETIGKKKKN